MGGREHADRYSLTEGTHGARVLNPGSGGAVAAGKAIRIMAGSIIVDTREQIRIASRAL